MAKNQIKKRNYKKEYRAFHSKPIQIKRRSMRNQARRLVGLKKGDKREVDHKKSLSVGGTNKRSNLRVRSKAFNRKQGGTISN